MYNIHKMYLMTMLANSITYCIILHVKTSPWFICILPKLPVEGSVWPPSIQSAGISKGEEEGQFTRVTNMS